MLWVVWDMGGTVTSCLNIGLVLWGGTLPCSCIVPFSCTTFRTDRMPNLPNNGKPSHCAAVFERPFLPCFWQAGLPDLACAGVTEEWFGSSHCSSCWAFLSWSAGDGQRTKDGRRRMGDNWAWHALWHVSAGRWRLPQ